MITEIITWLPRRRLKGNLEKKFRSMENTIKTIREEKKRAEDYGAHALVELYNTTLYLLSLHIDHTVLVTHLMLESNTLKRSVYSRQLASLYYEFFDDFPEVMGIKIRNAIENLPQVEAHKTKLSVIQKGLKEYRKTHEKQFYQIRNVIAAHRDHDGERQFCMIDSLKHDEIQKLAADLEVWFMPLWNFLSDAVSDYRLSPQMIRDVATKIEQGGPANVRQTKSENQYATRV